MANRQSDSRWWVQIGFDRSTAPLLSQIRARGFDTLVFDPDGDAAAASLATRLMVRSAEDLASIRADLRGLTKTGTIHAIATGSRDAASLRAVAALRAEFDLPGLSRERIEILLTRSAWKKALVDAGIATPVSAILEAPIELDRFLGAHPSALLKPATGGRGSSGVSRVRIGDPRNRELFDEARLVSDSDLVRAEAFVAGDAYAIDGLVRDGRFQMLQLGRKFSMRNLRGTLPTGSAWGTSQAGRRADEDPRWIAAQSLATSVIRALGLDETLVSLDILDDGEGLHVIDIQPQLGRASDRSLEFTGLDVHALEMNLALGERTEIDFEAGAATTGFAQRFFYPHAQGQLEWVAGASGAGERESDAATPEFPSGWRAIPLEDRRGRIVWDKQDGAAVERPRSDSDRIASALIEDDDQNAAWMRANEIDSETIFRIEEPHVATTTSTPPLWPMAPERG